MAAELQKKIQTTSGLHINVGVCYEVLLECDGQIEVAWNKLESFLKSVEVRF